MVRSMKARRSPSPYAEESRTRPAWHDAGPDVWTEIGRNLSPEDAARLSLADVRRRELLQEC